MKPFGYSTLLDCYDCKADLDDMEKLYRYLEVMVAKLGMNLMGHISVFHGPTKFDQKLQRQEIYEDKAGLTGFAPLIESAIVCHTIVPKNFLTLDVYSCKEYDPEIVFDYTKEIYQFEKYDKIFVPRGPKY